MIRCSGCGVEARGFASQTTAVDALKEHYRKTGHEGPLVLMTEPGYESLVEGAEDDKGTVELTDRS